MNAEEESCSIVTDKQKETIRNLIKLAQSYKQTPILLADDDKAGQAIQKLGRKEVKIISLKEPFLESCKFQEAKQLELEHLFTPKDKKTFHTEETQGEIGKGFKAKIFKNNPKLQEQIQESKEYFYILLEYLQKC